MKPQKQRSLIEWIAFAFEGGVRCMVGCFVLGIVSIIVAVIGSSWHFNSLRGRLPTQGPKVPIPTISSATLLNGIRVYQSQDCSECHTLIGADPKVGSSETPESQKDTSIPNLTHEGQRNPSIDWQVSNLEDHHRLYPNSIMPDYDNLPESDIHALASFLASRR